MRIPVNFGLIVVSGEARRLRLTATALSSFLCIELTYFSQFLMFSALNVSVPSSLHAVDAMITFLSVR